MKERSVLISHILMILTVLFWGNAFVGIKIALEEMSPFTLTLVRFFLASLFFLGGILLAFRKIPLPEKSEIATLIALGFLGGVIYHLALNYGEQFIPAGTASLVIGSSPIFTAILASIFLKERISSRGILGIVLAFGGLFLVSWRGSGEALRLGSLTGFLAVFLSTLSWSIYPILAKKIVRKRGPLFVSAYMQFFAFFALLPFSFLPLSQGFSFSPSSWMAVLFLAFFCTFLGYAFYNQALNSLGATVTSSYVYLVPVVALFFSWVLLKENLNFLGIFGASAVVLGVYLVNSGIQNQKKGESEKIKEKASSSSE
ncbi:MAG: DMT family transporter [Caldiserica bacterium]|nr:DMT family transporter [Caldisericota bacterium]MDH7562233.1 DMT family transporter [Caldisericota bacterium]